MPVSGGDSAQCMQCNRVGVMQLERVVKFATNITNAIAQINPLWYSNFTTASTQNRLSDGFPSVQYSARFLIARIQKQTAADAAF